MGNYLKELVTIERTFWYTMDILLHEL